MTESQHRAGKKGRKLAYPPRVSCDKINCAVLLCRSCSITSNCNCSIHCSFFTRRLQRERLYLQFLFCWSNKNRTIHFLQHKHFKYDESPWEEHRFPNFRLLATSKYTLGTSQLRHSSECQLHPLPNKHILPFASVTSPKTPTLFNPQKENRGLGCANLLPETHQ